MKGRTEKTAKILKICDPVAFAKTLGGNMAYCADLPLEVIKKIQKNFQISLHYDLLSSYLQEACALKSILSLEEKLRNIDNLVMNYFLNHPSLKEGQSDENNPEIYFKKNVAAVYFLLAVVSGVVDNFAVDEMLIKHPDNTATKNYYFLSLNRRKGSRQRIEHPQNRVAQKMGRKDLESEVPNLTSSSTILSYPFPLNA